MISNLKNIKQTEESENEASSPEKNYKAQMTEIKEEETSPSKRKDSPDNKRKIEVEETEKYLA